MNVYELVGVKGIPDGTKVVVVSRHDENKDTCMVCPLLPEAIMKKTFSTNVSVRLHNSLEGSFVMVEQIRAVPKESLSSKLASLSNEEEMMIDRALRSLQLK